MSLAIGNLACVTNDIRLRLDAVLMNPMNQFDEFHEEARSLCLEVTLQAPC